MDIDARKAWQEVVRTEAMGFQFSEIDTMVEFLTKIKEQHTVHVFVRRNRPDGWDQFHHLFDSRQGLSIKDIVAQIVKKETWSSVLVTEIRLYKFHPLETGGARVPGHMDLDSESAYNPQANEQIQIALTAPALSLANQNISYVEETQ